MTKISMGGTITVAKSAGGKGMVKNRTAGKNTMRT